MKYTDHQAHFSPLLLKAWGFLEKLSEFTSWVDLLLLLRAWKLWISCWRELGAQILEREIQRKGNLWTHLEDGKEHKSPSYHRLANPSTAEQNPLCPPSTSPDVVKEPTILASINFLSQVKPIPVAWANSEKKCLLQCYSFEISWKRIKGTASDVSILKFHRCRQPPASWRAKLWEIVGGGQGRQSGTTRQLLLLSFLPLSINSLQRLIWQENHNSTAVSTLPLSHWPQGASRLPWEPSGFQLWDH